jgi:3-hydroxyisobutyrate dehydrogenase-like beta-hydroxyacid dehydrogenase
MMKDFDLAAEAAKQYGVPIPVTALTRHFFQAAASTGRADKDFSVLTQLLEEQAGIKR